MKRLGTVLLLVVALQLPSSTGTAAPADDPVPITQRAIAAVVLQHAPAETTHRQAMPTDRHDPPGMLGADLRYHGDGEYDGDLLRTAISPRPDVTCTGLDECRWLTVEGEDKVLLGWDRVEPEEDPGIVVVAAVHGGELTGVLYAGPAITKDPRRLDLEIPVETLLAIATDPRLRLMTTPDVVAAGDALEDWAGGEPDPHAYDRVAQTDLGQVAGMLVDRGGWAYYRRPRVSPLKKVFGSASLGGRVDRRMIAEGDPSVVDVVAAPRVPTWLTRRPCVTGRYAAHCVRFDRPRGPVFLMWRPGGERRRGVVWAVQRRSGEVVALRTRPGPQGDPVPKALRDVQLHVDWWGSVRPTVTSRLVGLTTEKRVLDFDLRRLHWR